MQNKVFYFLEKFHISRKIKGIVGLFGAFLILLSNTEVVTTLITKRYCSESNS